MFADATGMSFAYTQAAPNPNWVEGGVYDFYGLLDFFNGNIQFNGVKSVSQPIQMIESDADVTVVTPTPVNDIVAYIASLPTSYPDKMTPLTHQYIQLTAKVRYQSSDNYHTMFVNPDYAGGDIDTAAQSAFTTNALIVYYKSNKAALVPFDGITVTVNVFLYTLRNDRNLYTVIFTGTTDDIQLDIDDTGLVDLVKTTLEGSYGTEYDEPTTLDLPTTLLGATVEWSSESPYFNEATGEVTMPAVGQESVTLTATITKGEATTTATITFLVGELPVTDLSVARGLDLNTKVRVEGTISSVSFATDDRAVLFLQDATGGIYVYKVPASFKSSLVVGNKVEIFGSIGSFGSSPQIIDITDVNVIETGLTVTPVVVTEAQGLIDNQGELVSVTGYLRQDYTGTPSDYHLITDMGTFNLRLVSGSDSIAADRTAIIDLLVAAAAGSEVTVIGGAQRNGSTYQVMLFSTSLITVGAVGAEADLADALAANYVPMVGNDQVTADLTLPTTSFVGSTVVWSSSNTDVISNTGVVTRPAIGQPDAVVTLTYTVTVGTTEAATGTVEFTVLALVEENPEPTIDLYFSEYLEGSSNNKAIEIYNPTNDTVDLSTYTVELYSNGLALTETPSQSLTLTGTLAPGAVYVIVNSGAIQAILDQADITSNVTFFNGDDALVLKNGLNIIDSFGQVGTDPGSNWGGVTAERTLVRKVSVVAGRTDATSAFDPSLEWVVFPADTTSYLGWHATDLFISEYIEGSSNNKAIEIFNPTAETIDMSTYSIEYYNNGAATPTLTYTLTGTLAPGEVYVMANDAANATILAQADITFAYPSVVHFNGDDTLVMLNGTRIVDSIGQVGFDPGTNWSANGVATSEMTLVRMVGTYRGRVDSTSAYDPSLYFVAYAADTFDYIGSHTN
jgi:predicted extracellular nuclease